MYIDGASRGNPGPAGVGVAMLDGSTKPVRQLSQYIGETTNNVAEYLALIYALQEALQVGYTAVTVYTDSELLARQVNGQYRVRDPQLRLFHDLAVHLTRGFHEWRITHIPRAQNRAADRLARQACLRRAVSPSSIGAPACPVPDGTADRAGRPSAGRPLGRLDN